MSNKTQLAHKAGMVKADVNLNLTREHFTHPVKAWFGAVPFGQVTYKMTFYVKISNTQYLKSIMFDIFIF